MSTKQLKKILVLGDFNYPNVDWKDCTTDYSENSDSYMFIESIRDTLLSQHVTEPTRGRLGNFPNILDLILTNDEFAVTEVLYSSAPCKSDQ